MRFEPVSELVTGFGVQERAIYRHIYYYGLSRKRSADTEKVLEALIEKGAETLSNLPTVDMKIMVEAIRELHKVRGKHQADKRNDADVKRDEENRQWAESQLSELMQKRQLTREEAIQYTSIHAPTINKWLH
jgi:aminoglycoside phosphotransferase